MGIYSKNIRSITELKKIDVAPVDYSIPDEDNTGAKQIKNADTSPNKYDLKDDEDPEEDTTDEDTTEEDTTEDDADMTEDGEEDVQQDEDEPQDEEPNDYDLGDPDGDPEEDTDDGGTDADEENLTEDEESETPKDELEEIVYASLSPGQKAIRDQELASRYIDLYNLAIDIDARLNNISKTDRTLKVLAFIIKKNNELKDVLYKYVTSTYNAETYIKNYINFYNFLAIFNEIDKLLASLIEKED